MLIIFLQTHYLVFNDTKVVEARLLFQKPTGGVIEIFCLEPHEQYPDITTAMLQHEKVLWQCLIGGASKWKHGQVLKRRSTQCQELILKPVILKKEPTVLLLNYPGMLQFSFAEVLHHSAQFPSTLY